MHRGYGYLQNYLDGLNMPPLLEHLNSDYEPVFRGRPGDLYVARQWEQRSEEEENRLLRQRIVKGLVFSSFRFDNPGPLARGDWTA